MYWGIEVLGMGIRVIGAGGRVQEGGVRLFSLLPAPQPLLMPSAS